MTEQLEATADLPRWAVHSALALGLLALSLLALELARADRRRAARLVVAVSGVLAVAALLGAVLRPVRVSAEGARVGPRLVVLLDTSRSMDLPALGVDGSRTRRALGYEAARTIARESDARVRVVAFGKGKGAPVALDGLEELSPMATSDLTAALEGLAGQDEESPAALLLISDGRLDRPVSAGVAEVLAQSLGGLKVPIHAVATAREAPPDASVRGVRVSGAAVAHQAFDLRVEVGCQGGLGCDELEVSVHELLDEAPPAPLGQAKASVVDGRGEVVVPLMLHRTGSRVLEVRIAAPEGDQLPDNDRRFVVVDVARDRVRLLHIAGRPTYDVRALRTWLKADESVDVVAFFILRSPTDNVVATQDELALIPFPVDELFSVHLPSFDAVVLQDFNAEVYGLVRHLGSLGRYVRSGGGLIMIGGPDSFGPGRYAQSPLSEVLPVELDRSHERPGADLAWFEPRLTRAGQVAPMLTSVLELTGGSLPAMPGTNLVGRARPFATVLVEHPLLDAGGAPMPVLAVGEVGSGRVVALTVDGTHRLAFSEEAAEHAGRAHGALFDGMVGWLMRDPRFESASIVSDTACFAGQPASLSVRTPPGAAERVTIEVVRLGTGERVHRGTAELDASGQAEVPIGVLEAGGYRALGELEREGARAPAVRRDFACEVGGDEWADPRPDRERLEAIAAATGGRLVDPADVAKLELPPSVEVLSDRTSAPLAPPFSWTAAAALLLGVHYIARRRGGLA